MPPRGQPSRFEQRPLTELALLKAKPAESGGLKAVTKVGCADYSTACACLGVGGKDSAGREGLACCERVRGHTAPEGPLGSRPAFFWKKKSKSTDRQTRNAAASTTKRGQPWNRACKKKAGTANAAAQEKEQ